MDSPLLTHGIARSLLFPEERLLSTSAEQERLWSKIWTPDHRTSSPGSVLDQLWDRPLVRCYDAMSGSQPCRETSRMLARGARMRLKKKKIRIKTLETHTDHKIWEDTPYISFSNCPQSLKELADYRSTRRGRGLQSIVVIDPRVRTELGLLVLHYGAEMAHYQVNAPYKRDYWQHQYLCLWEVTPAEVVGIWEWDDLRRSTNWYGDVIMPAVDRHRGLKRAVTVQRDVRQKNQGYLEREDNFDDNIHWSGSDETYISEDGSELGYEYESDDSYEGMRRESFGPAYEYVGGFEVRLRVRYSYTTSGNWIP